MEPDWVWRSRSGSPRYITPILRSPASCEKARSSNWYFRFARIPVRLHKGATCSHRNLEPATHLMCGRTQLLDGGRFRPKCKFFKTYKTHSLAGSSVSASGLSSISMCRRDSRSWYWCRLARMRSSTTSTWWDQLPPLKRGARSCSTPPSLVAPDFIGHVSPAGKMNRAEVSMATHAQRCR